MKILQKSKIMEAKLDFFNRQPPALQGDLISTGYFKENVVSTQARPELTQLEIAIPHGTPA